MRNDGKRRVATPFNRNHPKSKIQNPKFTIGIDLGSNTLRAVKRECASGCFVARFERIVRTADKLVETGRIGPEAQEWIVQALHEARKAIGFSDAEIRAVATEALRRASNAGEVLERLRAEEGVAFEVIDGEEEAHLTLLAVRTRLASLGEESDSFVCVDIGGGSTELIFVYGETVLSRSFRLGIVTLAQEAGSMESIGGRLDEAFAPIETFIEETFAKRGRPGRFVATAGTPTTIAALKRGMDYATYDPERINGTPLGREDLERQRHRLMEMDPQERARLVGVGREDLILAGIAIFDRFFDTLGYDETIVIDDGLREGVAIALCEGEE